MKISPTMEAVLTDPGNGAIFADVIATKDVHKVLRSLTTASALRYCAQNVSTRNAAATGKATGCETALGTS
jgi:hypothetical protein